MPYKPWQPHKYQRRGVEFLKAQKAAALFWDPGLGKSATVLQSFKDLKEVGRVKTMLVVAPLRVCQLVWRQEGQKWTQFRDLTFTLLHGPKKGKLLKQQSDIYLINPEGVAWLTQEFLGRDLPFDVVCIDELTKFKNHRAHRSRRLRKRLGRAKYRWGLTGSPAPNGYMDLFGQILLLDDGRSLGTQITYFRDKYFQQDFNGFTWNLRKGCAEKIEEKIAPIVLRMAAKDYLELPPLVQDIIPVRLPASAQKLYDEMKEEMILSLPEGVVTAANAGGVYSKLKQLSNGAVYLSEQAGNGPKEYVEVHRAKIEALEELIEELAGQPLLVAYEFQHDLARLREALGKDTPALAGLPERKVAELEGAWNRGELPVLLVHPASAGHGLNLQAAAGTGTAHICWFSLPWDLELYDQTIRRLYRQGSQASRVVNHIPSVIGGMDEIVIEALDGKDTTQQRLLAALNAEILRDDPAPTATGHVAQAEDESMVKKLGFRGAAAEAPAPTAGKVAPRGWGAPAAGVTEEEDDSLPPTGEEGADEDEGAQQAPAAPAGRPMPKGWGNVAQDAPDEQQEAIRGKISAPVAEDSEEGDEEETSPAQRAMAAFPASPAQRAMAAFPAGIVQQLEGDPADEADGNAEDPPAAEPEKPKRTRKVKTAPATEPVAAPAASPDRSSGAAQQRAAAILDDSTYAMGTDRNPMIGGTVGSLHGDGGTGRLAELQRYPELVRFHDKLNPVRVEFSLNAHGFSDEQLAAVLEGIVTTLRGR